MHCFQSWPPGWVTCIATLPGITLLALSVSIELVSSSARVTSVKFHKRLVVCDGRTSGPIDRTPGTPGSDKNAMFKQIIQFKTIYGIVILLPVYEALNTLA